MVDYNIIEKLNQYLLNTESLAEDFVSLESTLRPIKSGLDSALAELKAKSESSEELSDKVFYLNRYTDLIKKVDSIFDARTKRIQSSLSMLSKLALIPDVKPAQTDSADNESGEENAGLTPEKCAKIFAILQE